MAHFKCYSIFLTADILPTIYLKAFIFGQFLPFMAGFYSLISFRHKRLNVPLSLTRVVGLMVSS